MQNKVVIVIPIYSENLKEYEKASLKCCLEVLKNYDITFVCPEKLNINNYDEICQEYNKICSYEKFDDNYFMNRDSYSYLCLSNEFYERFSNYEYMLIYQLDCWVFRDELLAWCEKGYDYIGAPWTEKHLKDEGLKITQGGNGGLSLRKISSMTELMKNDLKNKKVHSHRTLESVINHKKRSLLKKILGLPIFIYHWFYRNYVKSDIAHNEDIVIAEYAQNYIKDFKFADSKLSSLFAIDMNPEYFFEQNNNQLPFGCHGYKLRMNFWKDFIKEL